MTVIKSLASALCSYVSAILKVQVLVEKGAISIFIDLLQATQSEEIIEQACWALGNIAGDNRNLRNLVLNAGAMYPLVQILSTA